VSAPSYLQSGAGSLGRAVAVLSYNVSMNHPQPGIFALGSRSHLHLEYDVSGDPAALASAVGAIREAANGILGVNLVVGYGPTIWARLRPEHVPPGVGDFEDITGADGFAMQAAQHDVWLWLHGSGPDALFDLSRSVRRALRGVATLGSEQPSFVYGASHDLTGFEDGTENPPIDEALDIATIDADGPCAGGSVALLQRWVHDLDGFDRLDVIDQEEVIGRTRVGSIELGDDRMSPRSHVARVVVEDEAGEELEVFRRSTAFGGVAEHGLMFVGFSADRARLQRMLERMAGVGDGVRDRLTEFSTPTSSAWYVVPPTDLLDERSP